MPLNLFAASDPQLDILWRHARYVWNLLEVGEGGVLYFAIYENPDRVAERGRDRALQTLSV